MSDPSLHALPFTVERSPLLDQLCLKAAADFAGGVVLARYEGSRRVREPSRYTVQRAENEHLLLEPQGLRYVNHSCAPNVFFDVDRLQLVSLRALAHGEELTFFYPSTEWSMAEPFSCACHAPDCLGVIAGARHVAPAVLRKHRLSAHVQSKLELATQHVRAAR